MTYQKERMIRVLAGKKGAQSKRVKLLHMIENMSVPIIHLSTAEVLQASLEDWQEYRDTQDGVNAAKAVRYRWAVNYIRHQLSDYEEYLAGVVGRVGVTEASDLIRDKVFLAIVNLYPEFPDECPRQSKSRRTLAISDYW
jgi:hypothetical protein